MAASRDYLSRFTEGGRGILEKAIEETRSHNKNYVSAEYLIEAFSFDESGLLATLLSDLNVPMSEFMLYLEERLEKSPQYTGEGVRISTEVNDVFKRALAMAHAHFREALNEADIFVALSQDDHGSFIEIFKSIGVNLLDVRERLRKVVSNQEHQETSEVLSEEQGVNLFDPSVAQIGGQEALYKKGDMVRIKNGAFQLLTSRVSAVDHDNRRLKLPVKMFNQSVVIELNFTDVEKLQFAEER